MTYAILVRGPILTWGVPAWFSVIRVALLHMTSDSTANQTDMLMGKIAEGDQRAFAAFYDAMSAAVFGTVLRILRDRQQSEEVTQEAFVALWSSAATWDPARGSSTTFLLTIARRRAVDRVRSEEARKRREATATTLEVTPDVAHERVETEETSSEMRQRLSQLPDDQRIVIDLAFYEGHTQQEISDRLGVPLGTVKSRMSVGMSKLRRAMEVSA